MRASLQIRGFLLGLLASIACHGEEGELRKEVAGTYERERRSVYQPPPTRDTPGRLPPAKVSARRYELTLLTDGRWTSQYTSEPPSRRWDTSDSGTYRIMNGRIVLRALTPTEDPIRMFWIGRDTLHEMIVPLDTAGSPWIGGASMDALRPDSYVVRMR